MEKKFKCPICPVLFEKQDELKEHLSGFHLEHDVVLEFASPLPDKPDSVNLVEPSSIPVIIRTEPTPTLEFPADADNSYCGWLPCCSDGRRSPAYAPVGCRECCGDCWQCCNICDDCQCAIM
uniref:C2H2-type domain-containing protein n=1 Tax=Culex tarsalis TaxID=7177 RepID=A0A1Q3FNF8_CULTA